MTNQTSELLLEGSSVDNLTTEEYKEKLTQVKVTIQNGEEDIRKALTAHFELSIAKYVLGWINPKTSLTIKNKAVDFLPFIEENLNIS